MIPVIVMTSDKYLRSLMPFAYLFNKYWGSQQEVDVVGFKPPEFVLPSNFIFTSLGSMDNYPVNKWSNAILDYLTASPGIDHFILMLEDYWILRQVDVAAVDLLSVYAREHPEVLKVDLCADRLFAKGATDYGSLGHLDLVKSDPASQYHMSLMTGIWNRDLFRRFVVADETPWEVELNGTPRVAAAGDNVLVVGTKQWPVKHTLAHRGGDADKVFLGDLDENDLREMAECGYLDVKR